MPDASASADFDDKNIKKVVRSLLTQISMLPTGQALNVLGRVSGHFLVDIHREHGAGAGKEAREHLHDSIRQGEADEHLFRMGGKNV